MCICMSASMPSVLAAQARPVSPFQGTDFQSSDELDVLTGLTSQLDVTWIARGRFSADLPNPAH